MSNKPHIQKVKYTWICWLDNIPFSGQTKILAYEHALLWARSNNAISNTHKPN